MRYLIQHNLHSRSLAVMCIAAPEDVAWLDQWERHLRPLEQAGLLSLWSERQLSAGVDRLHAFHNQCAAADLVVLLLSADFFSSPDCLVMMEQALQQARTGTTRVIPILLRAVAWQESPLAGLAYWPPTGVPITQWDDWDAAWDACVLALRRLLGRQISRPLPVGAAGKHADQDWDRMLRRLRRSYKELLGQSLHGIAWVELGLATHPDMVSNVTNLLFRLPQGDERLLAPGTTILDAYDEAEGELLILGAPGAGKSTLLVDLAQRLVGRAFVDPEHPLPVILRLSSWAVRQSSLADWMIEHVSRTYDVPHRLSTHWIQQGRLLLLLDGLDEMEEAARPAALAAINIYHRTHLMPLVVCTRQVEYEAASSRERLALQSAVIVQPLRDEQIDASLSAAGPSFAGVRMALEQEPTLRGLATTPLMLSVLLLTYRGTAAEQITRQGKGLEQQVWMDYITRQVAEKGDYTSYPLERTRAFLCWLAQQMRTHQQTTFYAEYLQTDWLTLDQQRSAMWLTTRLPAMIIGGCVGLLALLLVLGGGNPLQIGLLGGFIGDSLSQQMSAGPIPATPRLSHERWVDFRNASLFAVLLAASLSLFSLYPLNLGYIDWRQGICLYGLGGGLSFWIFQKLLHRRGKKLERKTSTRPSQSRDGWLTKTASPSVWQAATAFGAGMGLNVGLSNWLSFGRNVGLVDELSSGLSAGLKYGIIVVLVHVILAHSMGSLRFTERVHWIWRDLFSLEHLRTSLIVAGMLFLFFGFFELSPTLIPRLSLGLSRGMSVGLSFWLLLGLYQGMKQEHLEDQDRQRFNQGIRRSLRNGLLLGLVSTIIASAISLLGYVLYYVLFLGLAYGIDNGLEAGINGLNSGLSAGLSAAPSNGLYIAWVVLPAGLVIIWTLSGGLTVLRHYVIRWLLARHHTFPWRAQAFLDDATTRILLRRVGGGYSFVHRRLQDYFADAVTSPPQE